MTLTSDFTEVQVVNGGLRLIGHSRIDDLSEESHEGEIIRDVWPLAKRTAFEAHGWRFAMAFLKPPRTEMVDDDGNPTARYKYAFTMPSHYVRFSQVSTTSDMCRELGDFDNFGGQLIADAEEIYVEYVRDDVPAGSWPGYFINYAQAELAQRVAAVIKSSTEVERMEQLKLRRLSDAKSQDSVQQPPRRQDIGSWRSAGLARSGRLF